MSVLTSPSPSDFDRWEELLREGVEPSTAAKNLGFTSSAFRRADPERHKQARAVSQEARFGVVDERMERWAVEDEAAPSIRLAWARRWNRAYSDRVEVTGAEGGPVTVAIEEAKDALAARLAAIAERRGEAAGPSQPE